MNDGREGMGMTRTIRKAAGMLVAITLAGSVFIAGQMPARAITLPASPSGVVYSVGSGALGNGTTFGTTSKSLVEVCSVGQTSPCSSFLKNVVQLGNASYAVGEALTAQGNVYTWGDDSGYGGLGIGETTGTTTTSPVEVCAPGTSAGCTSYLSNITQIAMTSNWGGSLALSSSGNVYAWGEGFAGEIGNGAMSNVSIPAEVCAVGASAPCTSFLSNITELAAGCDTVYALSSSGSVYAWGYGKDGELGNGSFTTTTDVPVQVSLPAGVTVSRIAAAGSDCSGSDSPSTGYALTTSGNVYAWGYNGSGELGNGSTTNSDVPVEVEGPGGTGYLSNVTDIAGGSYEGLAVVGGNVYTWGSMNNESSSSSSTMSILGNNETLPATNQYVTSPVEVCAPGQTAYPCTSFLSGIVSVAGDQYNENAYAIDGGGHVFAWGGDDAFGELGDGPSGTGVAAKYAAVPLEMVDPSGTGYLNGVTGIGTSSDAAVTYVLVSQYTTTTTLTSSVTSPASTAGAITLTAAVNNGAAPSGTVTFKEGATTLGTVTLGSTNSVTYTIPANTYTPGTYSFTASYSGDTANSASTSSALSLQLAYPISMSVSAAPASTTYGSSVTLTTTVSAQNSANGTPTGTVSLSDPGTPIAGCQNLALNAAGVATCTTTALAVGSPTVVQASYSGSTTFLAGTANANVSVAKGSVSMTVAAAPATITVGQSATITATVTSTTSGTPTGTVSFTANGAAISGCQNVAVSAAGTATCTTTALPQGTPVTLSAAYSGDGNFTSAVQGASITVNQAVPVPATGLHHSSLGRGMILPGALLAGLGIIALLGAVGFRRKRNFLA